MKETNLKVKHQRKAAYKQLFSDALPLNSYGEALQVKNERFCQLFKQANKGMLSYCALIGKCALIRSNTVIDSPEPFRMSLKSHLKVCDWQKQHQLST